MWDESPLRGFKSSKPALMLPTAKIGTSTCFTAKLLVYKNSK